MPNQIVDYFVLVGASFLQFVFVLRVYVVFCFVVCDQSNRLPRKTCL